MKDLNKDIDKLFRDALNKEKEFVPFQEDDWVKLEQRLDRHERRERVLFWLKIGSGVAAICLIGLSWWLLGPGYHKPSIQQTTSVEKNNQQRDDQQNKIPPFHGKIKTDKKTKTSPSLWVDTASEEEQLSKLAQGEVIEDEKSDFDKNSWADIQVLSSIEIPTHRIGGTLANVNLSDRLERHPVEAEKKVVSQSKQRRISLALLAAPVMNGVDHLNQLKMGHDVGFLVTVGLTKKWSVSTGMVYAKKLYETEFHTYNSVDNGWNKYTIQNVDADCRVLDIPLNFNYTVINNGRNTIAVTTGLSSYLMLREDYRLIYPEQMNRPPKDYSLVNENKHLLSVLNLQFSYERRLTPQIGIGFQPYLKIPLNDIGFAKVRLQSLGVAVNMNWTINASSKK